MSIKRQKIKNLLSNYEKIFATNLARTASNTNNKIGQVRPDFVVV